MKNKQTAVEWLINEWMHLDAEFDMVLIDKNTYWEKLKEKHNQAKKMEKQQIIDSHNQGYADGYRDNGNSPIKYYTETFKNK
jgi:hypothetical protein